MIGVEGRGGVIPFSGYCDWSGGEGGWVIPFSGYCDWSGGEGGVIPFSGYCDWSGGERGVGSFHFLGTVIGVEGRGGLGHSIFWVL